MTFNDIFKSSFLENVSEFSILDTLIGLAVALVIGLFIFIIYKKTLTGVLCSSGFALTLAVIGSAIIGVILLLFANRKIHNDPYILVTNCTDENAENAVMDILGKEAEHCVVKSKTVTTSGIELTAELCTKTASTAFVNAIAQLPGVETATLVSYNGEYLS